MVERPSGNMVACQLSDLSLSGAALRLCGDEIECGEKLHLTLRFGEEFTAAGQVVSTRSGVARLELATLSRKERFLVHTLFCGQTVGSAGVTTVHSISQYFRFWIYHCADCAALHK